MSPTPLVEDTKSNSSDNSSVQERADLLGNSESEIQLDVKTVEFDTYFRESASSGTQVKATVNPNIDLEPKMPTFDSS